MLSYNLLMRELFLAYLVREDRNTLLLRNNANYKNNEKIIKENFKSI